MKYLKRIDWTDTLLTETEKHAVENFLVEYHDIFASHRMDIGMNTEFKVRLTPKDNKAVYNQNQAMPIHLKENLTVELALRRKYGITTVLLFSTYASRMFAQRKPDGKLYLLVDLWKINSLIADDCTNNNLPVSTLSDATQNLAGKSPVCRLDSSQTYDCLQMADQRSIEMLVLYFASRTFAYVRLHRVLGHLCLPSRVSRASTWTQLSRLTNVFNTWMILELQPIMLQTVPGTFGQSSSAFAMQHSN